MGAIHGIYPCVKGSHQHLLCTGRGLVDVGYELIGCSWFGNREALHVDCVRDSQKYLFQIRGRREN